MWGRVRLNEHKGIKKRKCKRLTQQDKQQILKLRNIDKISAVKIAALFDVSDTAIKNFLRKENSWKT